MHKHIDVNGRTWQEFTLVYDHPLDNQKFSVTFSAIDFADAEERLGYIAQNGRLDDVITEVINWE